MNLELGRTLIASDKEIVVLLAPEDVKNKKYYEIVFDLPRDFSSTTD